MLSAVERWERDEINAGFKQVEADTRKNEDWIRSIERRVFEVVLAVKGRS